MTGRDGSPRFIGGTGSCNGSGIGRELDRVHSREIGREHSRESVGNTVGKSVGDVVGIWPGDAFRNGWEHDRERELEAAVEKRKVIPSAICQSLKRTFAAFFYVSNKRKNYTIQFLGNFYASKKVSSTYLSTLIAGLYKKIERSGGGGMNKTRKFKRAISSTHLYGQSPLHTCNRLLLQLFCIQC